MTDLAPGQTEKFTNGGNYTINGGKLQVSAAQTTSVVESGDVYLGSGYTNTKPSIDIQLMGAMQTLQTEAKEP